MKHKDKYELNEYDLEQEIKSGSTNIEHYRLLGKIYLDRGDYNRLLDIYAKAFSLPLSEVERAVLVHEQGKALSLLGERENAARCFEKSLDILNNEKDSGSYLDLKALNYYNLFLLYGKEEGQKYAELALNDFELFTETNPDHEENCKNYAYLADLYLAFEKDDKALAHGSTSWLTVTCSSSSMGTKTFLLRSREYFSESRPASS